MNNELPKIQSLIFLSFLTGLLFFAFFLSYFCLSTYLEFHPQDFSVGFYNYDSFLNYYFNPSYLSALIVFFYITLLIVFSQVVLRFDLRKARLTDSISFIHLEKHSQMSESELRKLFIESHTTAIKTKFNDILISFVAIALFFLVIVL